MVQGSPQHSRVALITEGRRPAMRLFQHIPPLVVAFCPENSSAKEADLCLSPEMARARVPVLRLGLFDERLRLLHLVRGERQFSHPEIGMPNPAGYIGVLGPRQCLLKKFSRRCEVPALTFEISQAARDIDSLSRSAATLREALGFPEGRKRELEMARSEEH